jgi:hypothetical protein
MKTILCFLVLLNATISFSQINQSTLSGIQISEKQTYSANDTIPAVFHSNNQQEQHQPALYINKKLVPYQAIKTIGVDYIQEIKVEKESREMNGMVYKGAILITTKDGYQPSFISLNALKKKYTKLSDNPVIFLLNEEVIHADYDEYLVDEKYILKINIDKFQNEKEGLDLTVVKLITRTEENLKEANTIYIR